MKKQLIESFKQIYGDGGEIRSFFAPGRVNLIGEHTDYNGGHVFPCALDLGTYLIGRKRSDNILNFYSENMKDMGVITSSLDELTYDAEADWTNYPKGVIWAMKEDGYEIGTGMDILIYGNIPGGSGLSSSAALEVATAVAIRGLYQIPELSLVEIAKICQYSENNFNGCNCGIMDQFASAMGKKDHCIFLDTNDLTYQYVPLKLKDFKIVITNSKVKHSLVDSEYNKRRSECEAALTSLQKVVPATSLGGLTEAAFETNHTIISDPVLIKRARHAVYENQRTIRAVKALNEGNILEFGQLMNESHRSLRDDYEVSCKEIDCLVELAWSLPDVIGSRITGGGFGGCTVSLVNTDGVDHFISYVGEQYQQQMGQQAEFYVIEIGDGARELL